MSSRGMISFKNCHELDLPSSLSKAASIGSLLFDRTTMLGWPDVLAFTSANFPSIHSLGLGNVSLPSPPPDALTANPRWPGTLKRVYFFGTDIDELAQGMTNDWHSITSWICINCGLTTFPPAFFDMPRLERWAVWNSTITSIRTSRGNASSVMWPPLRVVSWTNNPLLVEVGDDVWRAASSGSVRFLSFAYSGVVEVSAWWRERLPPVGLSLLGYESPLCAPTTAVFAEQEPVLNCLTFRRTDFQLLYQ